MMLRRRPENSGRRWAFMTSQPIAPGPDGPMITRHRLIQTPWFGVYVHEIHRPDMDRDRQARTGSVRRMRRPRILYRCDGVERRPNPCRCACYGCMHHCGAHQGYAEHVKVMIGMRRYW